MATSEVIVSIQCITYNHKDYLRCALDSFLHQKTDFGFEIIVHDDASTDGTTDIVKEYASKYPDIVIPLLENENQWKKTGMKPVFQRMTDISKGKYIAYCEGDDYWQDPLKLQKQVDAMEKYPEAMMCYTGFQTVDNFGVPFYSEKYEQWNREGHSGELFFYLLNHNIILTPTTLFRKEVFYSEIYLKTPLRLDYFAFLSAAALGNLIFLPDRTACYRSTPTGAMATQFPWVIDKYISIREYFLTEYAIGYIHKPICLAGIFVKIEIVASAIRRSIDGNMSIKEKLKKSSTWNRYYFLSICKIKIENLKCRYISHNERKLAK